MAAKPTPSVMPTKNFPSRVNFSFRGGRLRAHRHLNREGFSSLTSFIEPTDIRIASPEDSPPPARSSIRRAPGRIPPRSRGQRGRSPLVRNDAEPPRRSQRNGYARDDVAHG